MHPIANQTFPPTATNHPHHDNQAPMEINQERKQTPIPIHQHKTNHTVTIRSRIAKTTSKLADKTPKKYNPRDWNTIQNLGNGRDGEVANEKQVAMLNWGSRRGEWTQRESEIGHSIVDLGRRQRQRSSRLRKGDSQRVRQKPQEPRQEEPQSIDRSANENPNQIWSATIKITGTTSVEKQSPKESDKMKKEGGEEHCRIKNQNFKTRSESGHGKTRSGC